MMQTQTRYYQTLFPIDTGTIILLQSETRSENNLGIPGRAESIDWRICMVDHHLGMTFC